MQSIRIPADQAFLYQAFLFRAEELMLEHIQQGSEGVPFPIPEGATDEMIEGWQYQLNKTAIEHNYCVSPDVFRQYLMCTKLDPEFWK